MAKTLNLEPYREKWAKIAKSGGWYAEPFFIQVFADPNTEVIYDSVSFSGMTKDLVVFEEQGEW